MLGVFKKQWFSSGTPLGQTVKKLRFQSFIKLFDKWLRTSVICQHHEVHKEVAKQLSLLVDTS
ncbi:hypothetical protein T10_8727 [Trichinella papuae]|uniref:Uncharacterized protein n=1 Tax=Trichinella papuae TaxID=268474 RepID=A0A0V1MFF5_9BILA|nr:hypothetical protein T10_8727 [Trichinella papuae]